MRWFLPFSLALATPVHADLTAGHAWQERCKTTLVRVKSQLAEQGSPLGGGSLEMRENGRVHYVFYRVVVEEHELAAGAENRRLANDPSEWRHRSLGVSTWWIDELGGRSARGWISDTGTNDHSPKALLRSPLSETFRQAFRGAIESCIGERAGRH